MKILNVRLATILLISGVILGGTVFFVHYLQKRRTAYIFLQLAREIKEDADLAKDQKDFKKAQEGYIEAIKNYGWYVKLRPDDIDALEEFGLFCAEIGAPGQAFFTLEDVLRQDSNRAEARRKLVEVAILSAESWDGQGKKVEAGTYYSAAKEHVLAALAEAPDDGELLEVLGRCQVGMGETAQAVESFEKSIANAPERLEGYTRLVRLLQRLDRPTEADQWARKLLEVHPDEHRAQLFYAGYVIGLLKVNSIDEVRKHPILLDAMVPGVLERAVEGAFEDLKLVEGDPDAAVLSESHQVVARAAKLALTNLEVPLDEPNSLWLAARSDTYADKLEPAVLGDARDKAAGALQTELDPDQVKALQLAVKHGLLVDGLERALKTLGRRDALWQAAHHGALAETMNHVVRALELDADNADALLLASQCAQAKRDFDEARRYAQRGIQAHPSLGRMYVALYKIELADKRRDEAVAALREGVQQTGRDQEPRSRVDHLDLLFRLADLFVDSNDLPQATATTEELEGKLDKMRQGDSRLAGIARASAPLIGYLRARIAMLRGDWQAAATGLEQVRGDLKGEPAIRANYLIGVCYGPSQLANTDQQLRAFDRALQMRPGHVQARAGLAAAYARAGRIDDALDQYRQATRLPGATLGSSLELVKLLLFKNRQLSDPAQRNWDEIDQLLDVMTEAFPDALPVIQMRAQVLVDRGRADEAERAVREARDQHPENVVYWGMLSSLAQLQKEWDQAKQILDEAEQKLGDSPALRMRRLNYLYQRYGKAGADQVWKLGENTDAFSEQERVELFYALASLARNMGDIDHARQFSRRIAALRPDNLAIHFLLFDLADQAGDAAERGKLLERMRQIEGEGPHWLYGKAVEAFAKAAETPRTAGNQLQVALRYLERVRGLRPSWSRVPLLTGKIYETQGKVKEAIDEYELAFERRSRDTDAMYRLVRLLRQRRQHADAQKYIRYLAQQDTPWSEDIARWDAEALIRERKFGQGLERARQAAADSQDYQDHRWLGQFLSEVGNLARATGQTAEADELLKEAEAALRRAVELGPTDPDTRVDLVRFLVGTRQIQEAEKAVGQISGKIPAEELPATLARCYGLMGKIGQAEQMWQRALKAKPRDAVVAGDVAEFYLRTNKIPLAQQQLQRIVGGQVQAEQWAVVWARRWLAAIFRTQGDYQNTQRALALIEENLKVDPSSPEDQDLKARLLSSDPQLALREQSLKIYESLESESPEYKYRLAQGYYARGEWGKASAKMRELLASSPAPRQPVYLATYIGWLMEHNELPDAEIWLGRLEELAPGWYETTSLRAEALFRRGRFNQTLNLLTGFLERPNAQPADEAERLALVSRRLEEFGVRLIRSGEKETAGRFLMEAEEMCRKHVRERPGTELLLAEFLGRQGKIDEALNLVERVWADNNPGMLAQTCSILLKSGRASQAQLQQAERIVQDALKRFDRPVQLLMLMAEVCTLRERYREAETYYRDVISKNSKNAVAMNNLAVLLAQQGIKLDESLKLIERAIGISGPMAPMLDSRATVQMARGRPEEALKDLQKAIAENPSPVRHFHQARAFEEAGQKENALAALQQAHKRGLRAEMLSPLEREAYRKLRKELQ